MVIIYAHYTQEEEREVCARDSVSESKRPKLVGTAEDHQLTTPHDSPMPGDTATTSPHQPAVDLETVRANFEPSTAASSSSGDTGKGVTMSPARDGGEGGKGDFIDATELERDRCCEDVREKVKRKFLVDMPEDFYQFWKFCKSLDPNHPECEPP